MDAKELRIWNILFSNLTDRYFNVTANDIVNILNDPNCVKPVKLTEFWLLRLEFKKVHGIEFGNTSFFHYENDFFWVYFIKGGFEIEIITKNGRFNLFRTFKYVHQLQNIHFMMTGKELTEKHVDLL